MMSDPSGPAAPDLRAQPLGVGLELNNQGEAAGTPTLNGKSTEGTQIRRPDNTGTIESFAAAALAAAPLAPVIAMLATIQIAVSPLMIVHFPSDPPNPWMWWDHPLIASAGVLVVMWLFLAGVYYLLRFTSAKGANPGNFHEITARVEELDAWLDPVPHDDASKGPSGSNEQPSSKRTAYLEINRHRQAIETELQPGGMGWVLGTSYVNLWERLHRAQEALIELKPREAVIRDAQIACLKIKDSAIPNEDLFLRLLNQAIDVLRLGSAGKPPVSSASANGTAANSSMSPTLTPPESFDEAVSIVRTIQHSLHEFRDGRRAALVRARNYMLLAMALTGVTNYILLWIAISAGIPTTAIVAAASLYLVGALVGLFSRLYTGAGADTAVDDFGLTYSRLFVTVILSGVASVLAVVLVAVAAPVATSSTASATDALLNAFNLRTAPTNILTAAVFGLTPGLIISRLTEKTDSYKGDLLASTTSSRPQ